MLAGLIAAAAGASEERNRQSSWRYSMVFCPSDEPSTNNGPTR